LELLRRGLRNDDAQFLSAQQEQAVTLALQRQRNFLACLPPGGGKSEVYRVAAENEPGHTTVVMCPNVALLRDQLQKASDRGLTTAVWTSAQGGPIPRAQLVFVALETITSRKFARALQDAQGWVNRIVYDEAHQLFTEADYR
ncbi:P-loop containing nucleoside triphosphate hydrolase protein, partial [Mycena galopus ATCC 62051]